jgi:hypothetical protein
MTAQQAEQARNEFYTRALKVTQRGGLIGGIPKFKKTLDIVSKFLFDATSIIFKNGRLVKFSLLNIFIYISFAKLSYNFVLELLEVWKREDKALT